MNFTSEIKIQYSRNSNARGTREWGEFKITSAHTLNDSFIHAIIDQYRFGDSNKFEHSRDGDNFIYTGKYDWGD